jgi:hypothetical protein
MLPDHCFDLMSYLKVLVRFFGHGTEAFIDRDKEDLILKALYAKEGVSVPRIFARFSQGRVEEWIESIVLQYDVVGYLFIYLLLIMLFGSFAAFLIFLLSLLKLPKC